MTPDPNTLRAAAERLRETRYERSEHGLEEQAMDMALLARAYLAEHPADEHEPITREWLVSVGGKRDLSGATIFVIASAPFSLFVFGPSSDGRYIVSWGYVNTLCRSTTRGEFRRLCKALGVELSEGRP